MSRAMLLFGVWSLSAAGALAAQSVRTAVWGAYEALTAGDDWSVVGAQVGWTGARGHGIWAAAEHVSRFGLNDAAERLGGVWHPHARWWVSAEVGTAIGPELVPKNSWEVDVTRQVAARASAGLGYQRRNYIVGAVDLVVPHAAVTTGRTAWDVRLYLARGPARRTDATVLIRAAHPLSRRVTGVVGAAAGRESFLVGTPPSQQLRSLRTASGSAGVRVIVGRAATVRIDLSLTDADLGLSRRGIAVGLDRSF